MRPIGVAVMGVLNVTPDSFSDGGRFVTEHAAVRRGHEMFGQGAAIVDVGGESTRPGAQAVAPSTQSARVLPVIEQLAGAGDLSIDTQSPAVARAAVGAGAVVVNDVSAQLADVAADLGAGWIAMHMQGVPASMQYQPSYPGGVVNEVGLFLASAADTARRRGIKEVWVDPGFGFGKTPWHNMRLLAAIDRLVPPGVNIALGTSRKSTLGAIEAASRAGIRGGDGTAVRAPVSPAGTAEERTVLSVASAVWAALHGADLVRVHDVAQTVAALHAAGIPTRSRATHDDGASAVEPVRCGK